MLINATRLSDTTWCLLIGVNKYTDDYLASLPSPAKDIEQLEKALRNPGGCNIEEQHIISITSTEEAVMSSAVIRQIENLSQKIKQSEILLIYFAGHGINISDDFALCFSDTDLSNIEGTAISGAKLGGILSSIPSRGTLLILDCCRGAGFAENAPLFFRRDGNSEFRILLSSTHSGENSWESATGDGTIFNRILCRIINGQQIVGSQPGLIYFSDLFEGLQLQMEEDLSVLNNPGIQQSPVVAGVYTKDPLLFVLGKLTLEQVKVRSNRYSKSYIRRLIRRYAAIAAACVVFFLAFWYSYLEKSQYVEIKNGRLIFYSGDPAFNAFGFPHLLWESDITSSSLKPKYEKSAVVMLQKWDKKIFPSLTDYLKEGYKEQVMVWAGNDSGASRFLHRYMKDNYTLLDNMGGAVTGLFGSMANIEDTVLLSKLAGNPRSDIRVAALKTLARIAPERLLPLLNTNPDLNAVDVHREVLLSLADQKDIYSKEVVRDILKAIISKEGFRGKNDQLLDAAVKCGYILSPQEILKVIDRTMLSSYYSLANYTLFTHQQQKVADLLCQQINTGNVSGDLSDLLYFLGHLKNAQIHIDLRKYFTSPNRWLTRSAVFCAVQHHYIRFTEAPQELQGDPIFIFYFNGSDVLDSNIALNALSKLNYAKLNIGETRSMLDALLPVIDRRCIPYLHKVLDYNDPDDIPTDIYLPVIKALRKLKYDPLLSIKYFTSSSPEIQKQAYLWYAENHFDSTVNMLLSKINNEDADFVIETLIFIPTGDKFIRNVKSNYDSASGLAKLRSAAILAAKGDVSTVLLLLSSPIQAVRDKAAEYVGYNSNLSVIASQVKTPFPSPVRMEVAAQYSFQQNLVKITSGLPTELQTWRVSIANSWENVAPGLQLWMDQRFTHEHFLW